MGLADTLADAPEPYRGGLPCPVRLILDTLPGKDRAALEAALDRGSGWQNKQLAEALAAEGVKAQPDSLGRHRRGDCRCGR